MFINVLALNCGLYQYQDNIFRYRTPILKDKTLSRLFYLYDNWIPILLRTMSSSLILLLIKVKD